MIEEDGTSLARAAVLAALEDPPASIGTGELLAEADEALAETPADAEANAGLYFSTKDGFVPALLGREVRAVGQLRVGPDGRLWRYKAGVYRPDGSAFVAEFCRDRLRTRFRRRHLDEVLTWCRAEFPSLPERPDPEILNVANGLLEWRTDTLHPHDPAVPSVVQVPIIWSPGARCPGVERFLSEVLPADAAALAFEIAGYSLLADQPLRRAVMALGGGRNGKSTYLGVLRALLGSANVASIPLQTLAESRFAAAELFGKLANVCGDLDARALRRSDTFKILTGGTDAVTAERKYGQPFSFVPFATLVFSANEPPASSDQTDAYFDRWIVLPFERRLKEDEVDPHLLAKLTTPDELQGLLVWAVDSLCGLMGRGRFDLPESVREAGRLYRERIDTVTAFVEECCILGPIVQVTRGALYKAYRQWCVGNGRLPVSNQSFGPKLRQELGGRITDGKGHRDRLWLGIGLLEEED